VVLTLASSWRKHNRFKIECLLLRSKKPDSAAQTRIPTGCRGNTSLTATDLSIHSVDEISVVAAALNAGRERSSAGKCRRKRLTSCWLE
jgi:hypothetical protein